MASNSVPIKVLIADDDLSLVGALTRRLKGEGFELHAAHDGYQTMSMMRTKQPDVLVLDINMPAGDGLTVHKRLANMADFSAVPVIYMTGEQTPRVLEGAEEIGAYALLFKPFDAMELAKTIRAAARG